MKTRLLVITLFAIIGCALITPSLKAMYGPTEEEQNWITVAQQLIQNSNFQIGNADFNAKYSICENWKSTLQNHLNNAPVSGISEIEAVKSELYNQINWITNTQNELSTSTEPQYY